MRILGAAGLLSALAVAVVFIGYFGIKNVKFIKAFVGAPNPVFEDCYVDLNGQEQFIRVMGRNVDNPVIILIHGGPDKAFYEIKGCGHTPQADKPEEVADIIAELNK